jgi:hypothetical protein
MALEYAFNGEADLTTDQMLAFMVEATGGTIHDDYVRRDGLDVTAYREDPGDEGPAGDLLGFTHRVTAIFPVRQPDHADPTRPQRPGHGPRCAGLPRPTPRRRRAVVQRRPRHPAPDRHHLVFDTEWDKWTTELPELRTL